MIDGTSEWRVVALASSVVPRTPCRVVHGDEDFVLFRDADGQCRALADRCAHRRAPLSKGRITPEFLIECPYHGWTYAPSGACAVIPNLRSDERIPGTYRVPAFGTCERDGFVQLRDDASEAEPVDVSLPDLGRSWEAQRCVAYPAPLFMEALVDCPSSVIAIDGVRVLDDHPFGDPIVENGHVSIEYAAVAARGARRPRRSAPADFAYGLGICASRTHARISLCAVADAALLAVAIVVPVPEGRRLTRALCRGSGGGVGDALFTISCREAVDPAPIQGTAGMVSRAWAEGVVP